MDVAARYRCAGISDPGRKRDNNEDRFHADPDRGIFFVIDGVGGHNAGEKAADAAYKLLRARLERQTGSVSERIREAITVANNEIHALAEANPEWEGMACVLTVAVLVDGHAVVGHVGDSRLYIIEKGEIRKITHDHSPVGEREDRGEIDELTAMRHPRRNEVYRDVGSEPHSPDDPDFIELVTVPVTPASALLLCSDGLSDLVPSAQILAIFEAHATDPNSAARSLIDAANEAGGKDNITVIVVQGREFSAGAARPRKPQAVTPDPAAIPGPKPVRAMPLFGFLFGLLLGLLLVAVLKPHWRSTNAGTTFGFGIVREPRIWRVNADIGVAINQALPGDTVMVAPGTYPEQISLTDGVAVVSERPREAVLQTSGVAVTADSVNGARIEGFRIVSDEGQPLSVGIQISDSQVQVLDVDITGAQTAGVEILGSSTPILRANNIAGNPGTGIVIRDTSKPRLVNNTVSNNGRGSVTARPGIEISGAAQPVLIGNTIAQNAAEPILAPQLNLESLLRQNHVLPSEAKRVARPPRTRTK